MNDAAFDTLLAQAKKLNGKRKNRIITPQNVQNFMEIVERCKKDPTVEKIEFYPPNAFVFHFYQRTALVTSLIAIRNIDEEDFTLYAELADAHRRNGAGQRLKIYRF